MPELPIRKDFLDNPATIIDTSSMIFALMAYPSLEESTEREKFKTTLNLHRKSNIKSQAIQDAKQVKTDASFLLAFANSDELDFKLFVDREFHITFQLPKDVENFLLYADSINYIRNIQNDEKNLKAKSTVCCILRMLLQLAKFYPDKAGGVSVKKAIWVLNCFTEDKISERLKNTTDIKKAWAKYKSVAHLIFAYSILPEDYKSLTHPTHLLRYLTIAFNIQEFLLGLRQENTKAKYAIQRNELLVIPTWLKLDKIELKVPNLTTKEDHYINSYINTSKLKVSS